MTEFANSLQQLIARHGSDKQQLMQDITTAAQAAGYTVADIDIQRPWGGFVRFEYRDGDRFVHEFFNGINPTQARLGDPAAELSPKILLVAPQQRLSWQVHARRAERWKFLSAGGYHKSMDASDQGDVMLAQPGDEVQFAAGECHRLVGDAHDFTVVAEIWQHTVPGQPSDEADITRLADDYQR